jgi:hypothetical protein
MGLETYSVGVCANAAQLSRGTFACWRTRGQVPGGKYTLADSMSLALAADLTRMGMAIEPAVSIGWAVRDGWEEVLLASPTRTFLLARVGPDGRWIIATARQRDIPTPTTSATLQADLLAVAKRVYGKLVEQRG